MNNSVLKKIGFVFIFLAGIGIGASGWWLIVQNNIELRYYLLEQPTGNQPQAQVANFVQAIVRGDNSSALKLWEIHDDSPSGIQSELGKRRGSVISNLIATGITPDYTILGVEWWTTCCEPSVTCDSRNAGGARIKVQFLDKNGSPILYTFDVFTREQPYWGGAEGYPPRDWAIRDVYPNDQEPLFWLLIYEPQIRYIQSSEP
jgi:hypothetical protein